MASAIDSKTLQMPKDGLNYQYINNKENILDRQNGNEESNGQLVARKSSAEMRSVDGSASFSSEFDNGNSVLNERNNVNVNNRVANSNSRTMIQINDVNSTSSAGLHRNPYSRSNPQLNTTSLVDVHPLSSSFMESDARKTSLTGACFSSSRSVILNDLTSPRDAPRLTSSTSQTDVRRITDQFTPAQIPIIGYEVMEERARFTIYKLRIDDPRTGLSWMVFRRYTDFVRLYQKLRSEHRNLVLPLPEKRLFRNNFDPAFLDERTRGLQVFVNTVVKRLGMDRTVREFFCLDEPPPVGDSEPEAQALFGALEDTVGALKNQIRQQEDVIKYMRQKVFYLEEKMKACAVCNPLGHKDPSASPDLSASSNSS